MAIPTGEGTEVLKELFPFIHDNNNSHSELLSGEQRHIYTIL